jgi:uncharacterized protein (TIGR03084 family)
MTQEVEDLQSEGRSLQTLLTGLRPEDWAAPTPFKRWTVWDVVAHLHLSDQWALASLRGRDAFAESAAPVLAALKQGCTLTDFTREHFRDVQGPAILASWSTCFGDMIGLFRVLDPKARLAWFGPDMGARSFVTARYMETWAHGQDIYDLLGSPRVYSDAIRSIATLGVKTFAFTFANRKLSPPTPEPYVRLIAPSGEVWEWNAPSETDRVEGLASEFSHVVTQNRNVADTGLVTRGDAAQRWMAIAQCFAGKPENPPAPGTRLGRAA